jgi:hypothetical protein
VALDFATRLKYARGGVRFVEGSAGAYSEVLDAEPAEACLVLVDIVAFARKGVLLARRVRPQASARDRHRPVQQLGLRVHGYGAVVRHPREDVLGFQREPVGRPQPTH